MNTKLPNINIELCSNRKIGTLGDQDTSCVLEIQNNLMKKVVAVQDKKKKRDQSEDDDSPYRWIEEDSLYMRQYGHHLMDDDHHASERGRNGGTCRCDLDESDGDLWDSEYHSPSYRHIPGGYKKPLSSGKRECSSPYLFNFASAHSSAAYCRRAPFSTHPSPSRKEDGYLSMGRSTVPQKKSFLPPIDPHISVKK